MRSAFLRDKSVLVDLFQDVARVELDFLVRSGLGFGFLFGLAQMGVWLFYPVELLLPAAGAVVGARPRPFFFKSRNIFSSSRLAIKTDTIFNQILRSVHIQSRPPLL